MPSSVSTFFLSFCLPLPPFDLFRGLHWQRVIRFSSPSCEPIFIIFLSFLHLSSLKIFFARVLVVVSSLRQPPKPGYGFSPRATYSRQGMGSYPALPPVSGQPHSKYTVAGTQKISHLRSCFDSLIAILKHKEIRLISFLIHFIFVG